MKKNHIKTIGKIGILMVGIVMIVTSIGNTPVVEGLYSLNKISHLLTP